MEGARRDFEVQWGRRDAVPGEGSRWISGRGGRDAERKGGGELFRTLD